MSSRLTRFHSSRLRSHPKAAKLLIGVLGLAVVAAITGAVITQASSSAAGADGAVHLLPEKQAKQHETPAPCGLATRPGEAECNAVVFSPRTDHQITADTAGPPAGALAPADFQSAYALPAGGGSGQTVAIVDAYGDSTVESDLAAFRSYYGLPACTSANGCFRKVDQHGGTAYPTDNSGWALETSLDVDAVSSACPACNILLVEPDSADTADLEAGVQEAVALGAKFISNSYGVPGEFADEVSDQSYEHEGVVVVASTGDAGNETNWPAADPDVVAAGGTTLVKDSSTSRGWSETAWAEGGSGCSPFEAKPTYQDGLATNCDNRAIADISADADPQTGLGIYDTLGENGWLQVGGTSLAAPLLTAMFAIAGNPNPDTYPVAGLYDPAATAHLFDVTGGANGTCGNVLCTAGTGWDGPTGLGTPDGTGGLRLGQGPHGALAGTITDKATGKPIAGAQVKLSNGAHTATDTDGHYAFGYLDVGTYDLTASAYTYASQTVNGVTVTDGATITDDLALTEASVATVTGTVTDGSGHGWPLYAEITIDGYPNGPIFTDPTTGKYTVKLPSSADYAVHITPAYDGYLPISQTLHVGSADTVANFTATIDATSCTAPGYGWNGTTTDFLGWTGSQAEDGWTVSGAHDGWSFVDPANRTAPLGGDDSFAIADSAYAGNRPVHTTLTSPTMNLSGQEHPTLTFDTRYIGAKGQTGTVDLSTDNGRHWTTIWKQTDGIVNGTKLLLTGYVPDPVNLDLSRAAGASAVRVRFSFSGHDGGYWELDNLFVGTRTCTAPRGGLVIGNATDAATGDDLPGVSIARSTDVVHPATTVATVDDPAVHDGFYWLFVPTGSSRLTASDDGYDTTHQTVSVKANQIVTRDWTLTTS